MDVNGLGSIPSTVPVKSVQPTQPQPLGKATPISTSDELEISSAGKIMESLSQSPEIRAERLAQIKAEIDAGTYETPDKLEAALTKLLAEIGRDEQLSST